MHTINDIEAAKEVSIRKVTFKGMVVNLLLAILKFAGGIIGSSQAVIADAVHSLSDCTTDLAIIIGVKFWSRPPDSDHPHGHRKLENLVTVFIGAVLVFVAFGLVAKAISSIHERHQSAPGMTALAVTILSIIVKEVLYRWTLAKGAELKSSAVAANAWHHRSDALSSIPAALAIIGTAINPDWVYLDHIAALAVSLLILQAAWKIAAPSVAQLLDHGAPEKDISRITEIALAVDGVKHVHAIRTRYTGPSALQIDLHIKVDGKLSVYEGHDISEIVKKRLIADGPDVTDVIVHLEPMRRKGAAEKPLNQAR